MHTHIYIITPENYMNANMDMDMGMNMNINMNISIDLHRFVRVL